MTIRRRQKTFEVFAGHRPVHATPGTFEQVFPQIETVLVRVRGTYQGFSERFYDRHTLGEYIDCTNPLCWNGGFRVGDVLRQMVLSGETHHEDSAFCQGHEASPKGRRKYGECGEFFRFTIDISYKPTPVPTSQPMS